MEYQKCFVFSSDDERPKKRRRLEPQGLHKSWPSRRKQFEHAWTQLDARLTKAIAAVNVSNITNIHNFLLTARKDCSRDRIPTGIVLLQPGSSSRASLADHSKANELDLPQTKVITLASAAAPNLKTALKSINHAATRVFGVGDAFEEDEDGDEELPTGKFKSKGSAPRLLPYDLQKLQRLSDQSQTETVVVHLEDTEGFDGEVLSDLIEQLSFWQDRIPIVLLMNVSTSLDMLERRLSKTARSKLQSKLFPAATCEDEFGVMISTLTQDDLGPVVGPSLIRLAKDRQQDYFQDISCMQASLKYAMMTAYFANPLTLFLEQHKKGCGKLDIPADHYEALRSIPSFRTAVRDLLNSKEVAQARKLLTDDDALLDFAQQHIRHGRQQVQAIFRTLELIQHIQRSVPTAKENHIAFLYVAALSGQLRGSVTLRNTFLALRKAPGTAIEQVLDLKASQLPDEQYRSSLATQLEHFRQPGISDGAQLNRTAAEQVKLVSTICKPLEAEIEKHLVNPKDLLFHEVFLYDSISPYREVFTPRPRQAMERALSTPHDYLDCDCCDDNDNETGTTQPASTILYSLYKESSSLINAHDAWQAFTAVLGTEGEAEQSTALFQRSLAELKHIGMVKGTRKRIDHIAKVAWPGL